MRTLKRDRLTGYTEIQAHGLKAWSQDPTRWMICDEYNTVIAEVVEMKTTVTKKDDWSGERQYKLRSKTEYKMIVRVGYKVSLMTEPDGLFYGAEGATIRALLKFVADRAFPIHVHLAAEDLARKAGVSELERMNCLDWQDDDDRRARMNAAAKLVRLANNLTAAG